MIALMEFITDQLREVLPSTPPELGRIGLELTIPEPPVWPRITYWIPNSNLEENREDFILEVDIWDHGPDTIDLETKTQAVLAKLNRRIIANDDLITRIYALNRLMLDDPDAEIRRRQVRFLCKTYPTTQGGN